MAFRASPTTHNPNNDFEVSQPPTDGVSSLTFSPRANLLVATSWDNQVSDRQPFPPPAKQRINAFAPC